MHLLDAEPAPTTVVPTHGPVAGGFTVTVTGTALGANDLLYLSLAGSNATAITWVSPTSVRVVAGAGSAGSGPVEMRSRAHGTGSGSLFTYNSGTCNVAVLLLIRVSFMDERGS
jgi:hypothetical protein